MSVWGLLKAFLKYHNALLDALNGKECLYRLHLKRFYLSRELKPHLIPSLPFPMKSFLSKNPLILDLCKSTIKCMGAKVPMLIIDNKSVLNVCLFRTTLKVVLDLETIIPSPLTVKAYDNTSRSSYSNKSSRNHVLSSSLDPAICLIAFTKTWLLPMLPSNTKSSLDTLKGCGKCLGYQPLNSMEMER